MIRAGNCSVGVAVGPIAVAVIVAAAIAVCGLPIVDVAIAIIITCWAVCCVCSVMPIVVEVNAADAESCQLAGVCLLSESSFSAL